MKNVFFVFMYLKYAKVNKRKLISEAAGFYNIMNDLKNNINIIEINFIMMKNFVG